jgi:hypothetical protein
MSTLQIKNLAIALEALSRVQGSSAFSYDIEKLLQKEIRLEEENHEDIKRSKNKTKYQSSAPNSTDDIPF